MIIRGEVIFRANKHIFVPKVKFRANNLVYWLVRTEVQLPHELTVFEGYPHGSFKTIRITKIGLSTFLLAD